MNFTIDASALVALIEEEEGYELVAELVSDALAAKIHLNMSYINYGEMLYRYINNNVRFVSVIDFEKHFEGLPITLIPADLDTVRLAAIYKSKGGISYADCFALATAKKRNSKLVTSDKEFKKFNKEVNIYWVR